jgi:hypothetical protein
MHPGDAVGRAGGLVVIVLILGGALAVVRGALFGFDPRSFSTASMCLPVALTTALLVALLALALGEFDPDAGTESALAGSFLCAPMMMPTALAGGPTVAWSALALLVVVGAVAGPLDLRSVGSRAGAALIGFLFAALPLAALNEIWSPLFFIATWPFHWLPRFVGSLLAMFGVGCS